jgi:hypothetical protein
LSWESSDEEEKAIVKVPPKSFEESFAEKSTPIDEISFLVNGRNISGISIKNVLV